MNTARTADPSLPPPPDTVERWAFDYILTTSLAEKMNPAPPPSAWEAQAPVRRLSAPGRPVELVQVAPRERGPRVRGLKDPKRRAALMHAFLHHELQACELMCWALLAFPETPLAFRQGLLREFDDEVRHMGLYATHLETLGHPVGSFPVRDWFWERVPPAKTAVEFIAILGLGFEGGNLDHSARFARMFREAGDEEGARIQEQVGAEEIAHVRFAMLWFERWAGPLELERWAAQLPEPLTPWVMRGKAVNRAARRRAGMSEAFLDELEAYRRD